MASTYSTSLRLELMATGDQSGTWGDTTNTNLGTLLEQSITGYLSKAMADTDQTLTNLNGASDEARNMVVEVTGALTGTKNVIVPTAEKLYLAINSTTGGFAVTFKTSAGTGIAVYPGQSRWVFCNGTNVVDGSVPKFIDSQFLLADETDVTKLLAFDLSGITTATTRTITVPDGSGTMSLRGLAETFSGVKTFSAIPVLSGGGITFPATQVPSADANTLDDYEEGTFTPTVKGSTGAGTGTYTTQTGHYTKVGNVVYFKLTLVWTNSSGTGDLNFGGLPVNSANDANRPVVTIVSSGVALSASNTLAARKITNNADIEALQEPVGGGSLTTVPLDTAGTVFITGQYWV